MERKNPQCLNCFLNNVDFIRYIPSPVFEGRKRVSGSCFLIGHTVPLPAEPAFGPEPQEHCTHQRLVPYSQKSPSHWESQHSCPSESKATERVVRCGSGCRHRPDGSPGSLFQGPLWECLPTFSCFCFADSVITFVDEEQQNKNLTKPKN